jgi:hypothetical protein
MVERADPAGTAPLVGLPAMDRLAPPPPAGAVAEWIEAATVPGDVVVDLHGRGGWIARSAVEQDRRAISIEGSPLARLLAELVLTPPDLRHLDASFGALAASPRRDSSLRLWIGSRFATRCATCDRPLILDELAWSGGQDDGRGAPIARHYRCPVCAAQRGGGESRTAPPSEADLELADDDGGQDGRDALELIRDRFPVPEGGEALVEDLLAIHTPRQLIGMQAILERIEGDLRAANVEAALRFALLGALLPASRLHHQGGRAGMPRLAGDRLRPPTGAWRERNPWLAFEDGYRQVRRFLQHLESSSGPLATRFGPDLLSLVEGTATVSLRVGTASGYRALASEARRTGRAESRTGVRLILAQPPLRPSPDRLAFAFLATSWVLGKGAANLLPLDALVAGGARVPWGWQAAALGRSLEAAEPLLARDGRAVLLCDPDGQEPLVAAALGGIAAGFRLTAARLAEDPDAVSVVELRPPGATIPPGPRTRANVPLPAVPGGAGDPDLVPGRGVLGPPERFDARPFSASEAARAVTETAVDILKARGEPARTDRLVGEILVGLDRAGHLRRLVLAGAREPGEPSQPQEPGTTSGGTTPEGPVPAAPPAGLPDAEGGDHSPASVDSPPHEATSPKPVATTDPDLWSLRPSGPDRADGHVGQVIALIRDEMLRSDQRRLVQVEPDRWWLADRRDREAATVPLADRVEWAIFSLLSTAGPLTEDGFLERIGGLFQGHDRPDETLVRACLEAYRSISSSPDRLATSDDLVLRTRERGELLALLADLGHRLGLSVWLDVREQERIVAGRPLLEHLEPRERAVHLPSIVRGPIDLLPEIDAIWYARRRLAVLFTVQWTAMLDEPIVRRGGRIPPNDALVRILVVPPERAELVRHKLERSPILRAAMAVDNWHILKAHHLRAFAELEAPTLEALEPYLGLDPIVERGGEQLPLFNG